MQRPLQLLSLLLLVLAGCGGGGGGGTVFTLAFATVPTNGTDGRTLSNVVVEVRNSGGTVETTAIAAIRRRRRSSVRRSELSSASAPVSVAV